MENKTARTPNLIHSVTKAMNILKCLRSEPLSLVEISKAVKQNKVTVHRLLKTLQFSGFVAQDPGSRKYYLGSEIAALTGNITVGHQNLISTAYQEMVDLRNLTGETVCLNVQTGMRYMCMEEVTSQEHVKFSVGRGHVLPLYVGAAGKNILAQFTVKDFELYLNSVELVPVGPNTITSKKALIREIKKAGKQGYAISMGEGIPWGASLSVPIKKYRLPAALSIVGPDQRWTERMLDFIQALKEARDRTETKLS